MITTTTDELFQYTTGNGVVHSVASNVYPDGMPLIATREDKNIDTILARPRSIEQLMTMLFWVDAHRDRGHKVEGLVLPFFPGARQDRLNKEGDQLFLARSVAKEINARNFEMVAVVDPHSDVVPALVNNCQVIGIADFIQVPKGKYSYVVAPDAGAEKRAGAVAKKLGVPMLHAWKTRDVATGAITGFGMEPNRLDGLVLVVDDICDGGGTFVGLGKVLLERGVKAHLFTTHGLYSQGTETLLKYYEHLYCTDSVVGSTRKGVIEIKLCDNLLKGFIAL